MTRCVFDTNILVSALLFRASVPGRAFERALDKGVILASEPLVDELEHVLDRAKFDQYVSREIREAFLVSLIRESRLVEIAEAVRACRDANDDKILELAVNGHAEFIVTGDADLLILNPFRGIRIVTPAEFLESSV